MIRQRSDERAADAYLAAAVRREEYPGTRYRSAVNEKNFERDAERSRAMRAKNSEDVKKAQNTINVNNILNYVQSHTKQDDGYTHYRFKNISKDDYRSVHGYIKIVNGKYVAYEDMAVFEPSKLGTFDTLEEALVKIYLNCYY